MTSVYLMSSIRDQYIEGLANLNASSDDVEEYPRSSLCDCCNIFRRIKMTQVTVADETGHLVGQSSRV